MALIPAGFRQRNLRLRQLPYPDNDVVERCTPWLQTPPEFIAYTHQDQGQRQRQQWLPPTEPSSRHATYDITRDDVVLFGPNHLVDEHGAWNLEAELRPEQYLHFYDSDNYRHILKGAKPAIIRLGEPAGFDISFAAVQDCDMVHLDSPVFLATPIEPDNWGRWLSTVVPKIHQYVRSDRRPKYPILCRSSKPWQKRLLGFLGADLDELIDHDPGRAYFCPRVVTTAYSAADLTPTESEMAIYQQIADRCTRNRPRTASRLFVSRATQSARAPRYRVLANEAELIWKLEELGFHTIEPETLAFEEQVLRFASADIVVGLGGAGMFNVLFCKPGTKVVTIESGPVFIGNHSRMFAAAGLRYGIVFGLPDEADPAPIHKRWTVDVGKVAEAIANFD